MDEWYISEDERYIFTVRRRVCSSSRYCTVRRRFLHFIAKMSVLSQIIESPPSDMINLGYRAETESFSEKRTKSKK